MNKVVKYDITAKFLKKKKKKILKLIGAHVCIELFSATTV